MEGSRDRTFIFQLESKCFSKAQLVCVHFSIRKEEEIQFSFFYSDKKRKNEGEKFKRMQFKAIRARMSTTSAKKIQRNDKEEKGEKWREAKQFTHKRGKRKMTDQKRRYEAPRGKNKDGGQRKKHSEVVRHAHRRMPKLESALLVKANVTLSAVQDDLVAA